ncbi:hypothetical protein PHSY_006923 [Pseudozyma hubeiensis SY62]|uniref:Pali-domain-containing protein n=1 Tax=Pseudozyma hubeiensis (strain SY62) TaxID=1305764 RepID=R9PDN0_PSEHS|nr:hypothetical protein PHSY_006923 [Pseudozyma hubeiensis SY62]GAC99322.1 hypothetical protein PHSY_006923 [Pseudozyma hubeiensis SY62]
MIRPATPGTLLTLAAAILLGLVTISTPIIKSIYFLEATIGGNGPQAGQVARFGTLGYCLGNTCSSPTLGYNFDPNQLLGVQGVGSRYTGAVIKGLTYTLILHPIALAFAVVAVLLGLISHCREFSTNCFGSFVTGIGALITLVAFGLDLALFVIAKKRIDSINGASASLGMAIWMTLAAWILMFLAGCAFSCGICSRRRRNRVKDSHIDDAYGARPNAPVRDNYGQQMRMDALDAETERKRRQATLDRNAQRQDLPKFAEYETEHEVPLKNDYDDGAYANGANHNQPGLAYSTNSNFARAGGAGAAAVAGGSVINGVGQGYGRRQAQGSGAETFANSPPMLNNAAGYGAHNVSGQRQNTASTAAGAGGMSTSHSDATYVPGVGPQPFREDSLTPAPRPYPQISSPQPMPDYGQHDQYQSQSHHEPQYDAYGNVIPASGSHYNQPGGARRQPTGEHGHAAEYSGATFGQGSRMAGSRTLPSIPQGGAPEPHEIVYDRADAPADRRQGTIDDGFGLASVAHGSQNPHETAHETGYDQYASSAYDHAAAQHQPQHQQYHSSYPSVGNMSQFPDHRAEPSASGQGYHNVEGSQYDDYQSTTGPPGYDTVAGGAGGSSAPYQHNHYPHEKS